METVYILRAEYSDSLLPMTLGPFPLLPPQALAGELSGIFGFWAWLSIPSRQPGLGRRLGSATKRGTEPTATVATFTWKNLAPPSLAGGF